MSFSFIVHAVFLNYVNKNCVRNLNAGVLQGCIKHLGRMLAIISQPRNIAQTLETQRPTQPHPCGFIEIGPKLVILKRDIGTLTVANVVDKTAI